MPMDVHNVRLRFLAKYGNCKKDDIPIVVSIFLEEYQNCDWDDIPMMISDYLSREVCNCPYVVVSDETDEDEEENEANYYPYEVSQFDLQDSSIIEPKMIEDSDLEDDEDIEYNDYYSNDYVPRSFRFVFQDDSDDEEEEYYEYNNYPQPTSQVVLQESDSFELEPTENSEVSDYSDSDFGESMELLEISDHELVEKGIENDQILDAELDNLYHDISNQVFLEIVGDKLDGVKNDRLYRDNESSLFKRDCKLSIVDNLVLTMPLITRPYTDLKFDPLSSKCKHDFVLTKEPKPPDLFISVLKGPILFKNIIKIEVDKGTRNKCELNSGHKFHFNLVKSDILNDHGNKVAPGGLFLVVESGKCTIGNCTDMLFIDMSNGVIWKVRIFVLEKFYLNRKTKNNFLRTEYDWKGVEIVITDPP